MYQLNQELFETNTLGKLRMQGWIVEHMRLLHCGTMAICAIPRSVELELGVTSDDMDNISNFPRTVAGVNVAATIRETEDGLAKISVRRYRGMMPRSLPRSSAAAATRALPAPASACPWPRWSRSWSRPCWRPANERNRDCR